MNSPLFESVNLKPLALAGEQITGEALLARLPRVRDLLEGNSSTIRAEFSFSLRGDGRVLIRSHLEGELPLKCQRCLGDFTLPVSVDSNLVAVESEAAAATLGDADIESVISADGSLVLADIVEEELLLALPIAPKHGDAADCRRLAKELVVRDRPGSTGSRTHQPFKDLKNLMH